MKLIVENSDGERIDAYLSNESEVDLTRAKIQQLIKTGNILVNNSKHNINIFGIDIFNLIIALT